MRVSQVVLAHVLRMHILLSMNDALLSADADIVLNSFRSFTGKRKGAVFVEDGAWWAIDAAGHQWAHVEDVDGGEDTWERVTDDDDAHVLELASERRAAANVRRKDREVGR